MRRSLPVIAFAAVAAATLTSMAAEPAIEGNPAPPAESLLAGHPETAGVFEILSDGSIRHIQSGFVCPPRLPNTNLWHLMSFKSPRGPGTDVSCDYGRIRHGGKITDTESKFSIFLVKADPTTTLEDAYQHYLTEMHTVMPSNRVRGDAIDITNDKKGKMPAVRSELDEVSMGNRTFRNELAVGLVNGWIVELRSTYPAEIRADDPTAAPAAVTDLLAITVVWATYVQAFAEKSGR